MDGLPLRCEALEGNRLYDLLRAAGHAPRIADEVIGARAASSTEARLLGETRNAPLLTMTRTAWDASGRAVE
ncbi:MAG TPA: UTRA domain-containing protein [Jiangellaceae bacterium]|nr:UTRA domain-containing protein [Jiangellaceae bacterium]